MPSYLTPGIYVEEVSGGSRPIEAVGTSTPAFLGIAPNASAKINQAVAINNWAQFARDFIREGDSSTDLSNAVFGFFHNGGARCWVLNIGTHGSIAGGGIGRQGVDLLEAIDDITIVAAPGFSDAADYETLLSHCEKMRDRIAILDAPAEVDSIAGLTKVAKAGATKVAKDKDDKKVEAPKAANYRPRESASGYGAFYYPYIVVRDPLNSKNMIEVPPSGHLAGVYGRTDNLRGVHKAPANEQIMGALDVAYNVTPEEQGTLNPNGVNVIRSFSKEGIRVWGARTVAASSSEYRYLNVRRLMIMVEQSIKRNTSWIVFEPNTPDLWKSIRRDISAFLKNVWRSGALFGDTPEQAFFVKCDAETNPPEVIDAGQLIIEIGVSPVKPAEFVVFRIGINSQES
ncbi:MAG: phage tail sheath family protein [Lentisphaeraceae bacterium]|nr:phage tail sheath family protein [Lentisphaeraceae bacterium]